MPDLIRHPEHTEITEFRLPDRAQNRLHRNDVLKVCQTFYQTIKNLVLNNIL